MDFFTWTNNQSALAKVAFNTVVSLIVGIIVVVKCVKGGMGFSAILIGGASGGFVLWLTQFGGMQTLAQIINNTVKSAG